MNKPILTLKNITLQIAGVSKPVLNDISYNVYEGDFVILLGSNGSGKSSLLKVIDGRYQQTSGGVCLNDRLDKSAVTTVTQSSADALFMTLSVYENYQLIADDKGSRNECQEHLRQFNPRLVEKLDDLVCRLSGGEKQALVLALASYKPGQLLLLDEHTAALDPVTSAHLMRMTRKVIKEKNLTCIMTTHSLRDALQFGNRILSLQHGKVFEKIDAKNKAALDEESLMAACY